MDLHLLGNDGIRIGVVQLVVEQFLFNLAEDSVAVLNEGKCFYEFLPTTFEFLNMLFKFLILFLVEIT